jgi:CO/xanthine dehydrogenase FAD-binding subunit
MAIPAPAYHRPSRLDDALAALASRNLTVLAGGTDYYPARVGQLVTDDLLDVTAVEELRGIRQEADSLTIGATTTWDEILGAALPPAYWCLQQAARQVGAAQIQSTGTIGGNLCNASPAADGIPPLLALDAKVVLRSVRGERTMPLSSFLLGNRRTARQRDELLTSIRVPARSPRARSAFLKLGSREYLVISIVMVAAVLETEPDGFVRHAAVAVGACSPVAQRLPSLQRKLAGRRAEPALVELIAPSDLDLLSPIDDVRATAAYRRDAALTLVRRALAEVLS